MIQNGVVCYPGPAVLLFTFRFEYLITGPKSYRDFRETSPWNQDQGPVHTYPNIFLNPQLFLCGFGFGPHASGESGLRIRNFLNPLS